MRYHDITRDDMRNGDGLRVVLWVSGCDHHCLNCHNPITWDLEDGLLFDDAARDEIFAQLEKDYIAGLTFSGGDPLHPANQSAVYRIAKEGKERYPDKTIWLYTGALWEEIWQLPVMRYVDVCVDGEFDEKKKDVKLLWKGSQNQRVIDVPATLQSKNPQKPVLYCEDYAADFDERPADTGRAPCEG